MIRKLNVVLILLISLMVNPFLTIAQNENSIDEVIWVVGDEAILRSQVEEERIRMLYSGERLSGDPYCIIPEQIAIQKLFLHQAKLDSIEVSDQMVIERVESHINDMISKVGSKEKVEEYFKRSIPQLRDEYRTMFKDQGVVQQMQQKLVENIKVTPAEVRKYYESLPKDSIPYIQTKVEAQIITFEPRLPVEEVESVKSRLRDFTERVNKGEADFSTLAILYSEDLGSARNGGELGFAGKGSYVPEFSAVAFQLNDPNKISRIVETEFGFHIIQLIEKRGDRANFRHILLKPKVSDKTLQETLVLMDSLKADIDSAHFNFEQAALIASHDKATNKNNGLMVNPNDRTSLFQMEELPPEVAKIVDGMKINDISKPFVMTNQRSGKDVVAMVKLKNRVPGHKATVYDDYQELKGMLEAKKSEEIIKNFIKKKQSETYIRIKDGWKNCDFQYPGWIKN